MGHNSVVSGHSKSTRISRVVNETPEFGVSQSASTTKVNTILGAH